MKIVSQSTATYPSEWLWQGTTGYVFLMPDSTTPTNNGLGVIDADTTTYQGILLDPRVISGVSTGPEIRASTGPNVFSAVYYNRILYSGLVTDYANYLYVDGNTAGNAPGIEAFGVDTDVDIQVKPKGAGAFMFNYASIAPGGGAAATLGTIGGSGPGAAAQAKWLKVKIGVTVYFLPAWST